MQLVIHDVCLTLILWFTFQVLYILFIVYICVPNGGTKKAL